MRDSFQDKLREDVRTDDRYLPARMHGVVTLSGNSVYVACVIATEAPTTGSALL